MQANHVDQPYDLSSAARTRTDGESLWTPAPDALLVADGPSGGGSAPALNVHGLERLASGLVGGLLLAKGMAAHGPVNKLLALVGSALVYRGVSGHCQLYQALGIDTAHGHG